MLFFKEGKCTGYDHLKELRPILEDEHRRIWSSMRFQSREGGKKMKPNHEIRQVVIRQKKKKKPRRVPNAFAMELRDGSSSRGHMALCQPMFYVLYLY